MKMTQFVATCLILFLSLKAVHSQTGCATPYISWVNKTYETTLESLSDREGTPRGYGKVTLPNPERMVPDPCIEITAPQTNQYIEVNLEVTSLTGNSYVCVTVNDSPEPSCGNGRVSYCGRAPTNDLIAKIFCDASCDLSDVELYYRVVLSPAVDFDDEYWCDYRTRDFPSGLLTVEPPTDFTQPTAFTGDGYGICALSLPLMILLVIAFLGLLNLMGI